MKTRRTALGILAAPLVASSPRAQGAFPSRPLRLIVTYPPGGVTDIMGRISAEALGPRLGQPVVVENRAGAGGNIGVQAAAAAEPDGYTLLLGTAATHGVNPVLYANSGVDAVRDFVAVGTIADMANVLSVNPRRLDVKSVAELVETGKRRTLVYGSVGNGSSSHLSAAILLRDAGFAATHVPYRGSSPAVAALLAGEFDFLFDTTATSTGHVRAGAFRALAVSSGRRSSALPEVPTTAEVGLPGFVVDAWFAFFAPAGTPPEIVGRINAALREATTQPDIRRRAEEGGVLLRPLTVAEMDAVARREIETLGRTIRENGITLE